VIKAVIFDIDGTLVDSVDLHAQAWQEAFRHFGHDPDYDRIRSQIGKGGDQLIPALLDPKEAQERGPEIAAYRESLYASKYLGKVQAFPKSREILERVKHDGKKVALASSGEKAVVKANKKIADIDGIADVETGAADVERSKPHPDIFRGVLEKLDVPPSEAIVVGDTPYDAEAAAQIGLRTIGVLCGGFAEQDLRAAGCIAIYRDPADLLAHYGSSPLSTQPVADPTDQKNPRDRPSNHNRRRPQMFPKLLSTRTHGLLDLATIGTLLTLPRVMGWSPRVTNLLTGTAVGALGYSLLTRYEMGLVKVLPMKAHLALDAASGAALCASPLLLSDEPDEVKAALVGFGLFELSAAFCTQTEPANEPFDQEKEKASRAATLGRSTPSHARVGWPQ
jgi:HAD superfamily hydrolase (TIGR01509 family)